MAINGFDINLKGFRNLVGDYARSFMFSISIPEIDSVPYGNQGGVGTISSLARTLTLPSYTIQTAPIGFQGLKINVATTASFASPWDVSFLSDEKQILRKQFLNWMRLVYDAGNMTPSAIIDYKRDDIVASQLDRNGDVVMTYKFYGAYPIDVAGFTFNHDEINPQTFGVKIAYDFFTIDALNVEADNQRYAIGVETGKQVGSGPSDNLNNVVIGGSGAGR
jgi:hypothetical protein